MEDDWLHFCEKQKNNLLVFFCDCYSSDLGNKLSVHFSQKSMKSESLEEKKRQKKDRHISMISSFAVVF